VTSARLLLLLVDRSQWGTVALSDRPTRAGSLPAQKAPHQAFGCPVYYGFQGSGGVRLPTLGMARASFALMQQCPLKRCK
jgi:hypothetical protein